MSTIRSIPLAEEALNDIIQIWAREFNITRVSFDWEANSFAYISDIAQDNTIKPSVEKDSKTDRYFELLSPLAFLPKRATKGSAGYDFFSPVNIVIHPNETIVIDTGVSVFMNIDEVLLIYPRSSVALHKDLVLKNTVSVIDSDFQDEIKILITNIGKNIQCINRGDKIAQGIFQKFLTMNDIPQKKRDGGIGSTGF